MVKNKKAIVIGGSRGIGEAIAKLLAMREAEVCLMSRNEEDLKQVVEVINSAGGKADYILANIADYESVKNAFANYQLSGRKIDILVNNAGIYRENSETHKYENNKLSVNLKIASELINTNLLGYWWSTLLASPLMNKGGSVINISSVNGIFGKGNSDIYDFTKAGINNLTLNQARQFFSRKIRVNCVCPSSTVTPMRDLAMSRYLQEKREDFDQYEASTIPFQRLGKTEDIAEMVLFLASEKANYITGQIISVDGGYLLKPMLF